MINLSIDLLKEQFGIVVGVVQFSFPSVRDISSNLIVLTEGAYIALSSIQKVN